MIQLEDLTINEHMPGHAEPYYVTMRFVDRDKGYEDSMFGPKLKWDKMIDTKGYDLTKVLAHGINTILAEAQKNER